MKDEKLIREELNKFDKDKLIDLCLQYKWESMMYEQTQNQKAIECLKEVKEIFLSGILMFDINSDLTEREQDAILDKYEEDKRILADIIDNKIKELEEGK